jgi:hypothetical protein
MLDCSRIPEFLGPMKGNLGPASNNRSEIGPTPGMENSILVQCLVAEPHSLPVQFTIGDFKLKNLGYSLSYTTWEKFPSDLNVPSRYGY